MLALAILAAATLSPAAQVEAANERIAVAAMVRCPKSTGDEIVVCARASARDKLFLPLPSQPAPGSPKVVNALGERARLAAIGKYSTPSPVGPNGEYGSMLHMISEAVGEGTFTPLRKRFSGPDVEYVSLTSGR